MTSVEAKENGKPPWEALPWPDSSRATVPYWVYSDERVLERERTRIFSRSWNYVGLLAELDEPGSFFRSFAGDVPVIVTRDADDSVSCLVNRCGHRGVEFCQEMRGHALKLVCPYHQWTFTLQGNLTGVPFRNGICGEGGLPADFDFDGRGLQRLQVAVRNGVIFASLDPEEPDLEVWLGPRMTPWFDRTFDGRELRVLGTQRQRIRGNWKLYAENLRDPYHAILLHVFFVNFGLGGPHQPGGVETDEHGRHSVLYFHRTERPPGALRLQDPRILQLRAEREGATTVMHALWPNLVIGTQNNCPHMRHIVPRGPHEFDLVWTYFGYEDDDDDMIRRRIRQSAMQGPAGYISIDDSEMFVENQSGITIDPAAHSVIEMGGRGTGNTDYVATETAIRSFYAYYRRVMDF